MDSSGDQKRAGQCTVAIDRTPHGYVFHVIGRATLRESPTLRGVVCQALEDGADVVLDLSDCDYLDSTFLGCLVLLHKRGLSGPGRFLVHADSGQRQKLLASSQLHRFLAFADECPRGHAHGDGVTMELARIDQPEFGRHVWEAHCQLADLGGPSATAFRRIAEQLAAELRDDDAAAGPPHNGRIEN